MDMGSLALLAAVAALIAAGLVMRRRYGNLYQRLATALERTTGWSMAGVARGLGLLTLVLWAAIYLLYGSERETGLRDLIPGREDGTSVDPGES